MIDRELIAWPAAYARLALVEGGSAQPRPAARRRCPGGAGPMIYVAAVAGGAPGRDPRRARRRARRCSSCPRPSSSAATRAGCAAPRARRSPSRAARASCSAPAGGMSARAPRTWWREASAAAMSAGAPTLDPVAAACTGPGPMPQPRAAQAERPWVRLATFTALAGYGLVRWATLVRPEPGWRLLGLLALAVALAGGVPLIARQQPAGGGRGVGRGHPPGLPGVGTALALAQAHEHRAHRRPDRARAQPPAQRAGPLPGRQRRRAPGDRAGRGGARPRRRRRAGLRRRRGGPGRRTPARRPRSR